MENFKFSMFNGKFKLVKEQINNIITPEKNSISFIKYFILWDKRSIIYKRKKWDRNIEICSSFFKSMKNEWNIKSRKNRRKNRGKSRILFYIYIYAEKKRTKTVPQVLSFPTN